MRAAYNVAHMGHMRSAHSVAYMGDMRLAHNVAHMGHMRSAHSIAYMGDMRLAHNVAHMGHMRPAHSVAYMGDMRLAYNVPHMGHMRSAHVTRGTHEKCIHCTYWLLNFKEQDHLEEYDNIKIPISMMGAVCTAFIRFTVGTSGRLLSVWYLTIGFYKGQRIS
jgi:hypothetical protein